MDSCFPLTKTSPVSSALTVAHLIRNIEQLKNKDKLISQLEKDLGRQAWGAATHFAVLERRRSEGSPLPPGGLDLSPPFRTLPEGSDDPNAFHWTPTSIQTPGDVEDVWTSNVEEIPLGKLDLPSQLKGTKDRNKELVEKCRSFLQQNKELTAQNRAFQESSERAAEDTKKAQELLEHSKLQLLQVSRQLSQLKAEKMEWEQQVRTMEGLRQERMEDKKMINALRKACSDKDRRIELIQHRKRRRRMLESAEKVKIQNAGLKETSFGYEEDDKSHGDGDQSVCSLSSTISDDSVWDDVLSKEEMERQYQRLMMEQMELQKAHAMLQMQTDNLQDPQRENLAKSDLQNDLFLAQCRIEQLEHFINEDLQGQNEGMIEERERILTQNKSLMSKIRDLEQENKRLHQELVNVRERNEELEFQLVELEEFGDNTAAKEVPCQEVKPPPASTKPDLSQGPPPPPSPQSDAGCDQREVDAMSQGGMEQLLKEVTPFLKDKGRDAEAVLRKLDAFCDREKALESMAHDLQQKVISLQQEKNALQDRLLLVEQSQPGKGGNSALLVQAKERQENLALKAAIESQSQLVSERSCLQEKLEDLKVENEALKQHINVLAKQPQPQQEPAKEDIIGQTFVSNLQAPLVNTHQKENSSVKSSLLSRKPSDRKSKSRDGEEEPTLSKRRKNSVGSNYDKNMDSPVRRYKSVGDVKSAQNSFISQNMIVNNESGTMTDSEDEKENVQSRINQMEQELTNIKSYNDDLVVQLRQSIARKLELESGHQGLQEKIMTMEQDLDLLHKENVALGQQLRQRVEEFQFSQDERNPRVSELEEFIEDLQDRLKDAENAERQLREKLKLFEKSVEESETQEMMVRERCEQLLAGDYEAKKQIQALQRIELELRDIVLEKEIVEQALRDKVDFLQKAEAASVQRIEELEGIVEDLRLQLEEKKDGKDLGSRDAHKMTEMKHQMTFLETDNKALSARVAELEENEEILRENWRRVADEDFNRTQCLEEKVKMLEGVNRDLKLKLKDAQEYLVIDMSKSNLSLAAELAESESKIFDDSSDEEITEADILDEVDSPGRQDHDGDSDKKLMREKMRKLERQLSEVSEQKNTKIESLQEQLVGFKETEIKLSETISEMEMTERELRAKLALYESSEVTVEKMLKYQSKIEELRTSQESLLDQLEIKENQEMTLQEKMQEMERTLRGKIVTLEVEMKGFKKRELQNAGQIRELEKQESELSEKVAQQAEKENKLYVRISSLMDELKAAKTEAETSRKQLEEKEDMVRQAKLLEVKLLEIEIECGKKVSTLNAKLRHREEEFRQKESAYEEQISILQNSREVKSLLEDEFAQKEYELQQVVTEKENTISDLLSEISELRESSSKESSKIITMESELKNEQHKLCEKEELIRSLKEEINSKEDYLDSMLADKDSEHEKEKQSLKYEIGMKEKRVSELETELRETEKVKENESELLRNALKAAKTEISNMESFHTQRISEIGMRLASKSSDVEEKLEWAQSSVSDLKLHLAEKCTRIEELESEIEVQREMFENDIIRIDKEKDVLVDELKSRLHVLNSEVESEISKRESDLSIQLKDSQEREASLKFDVSNLQHHVEQHKHELIAKLSELEAKNKAHCELTLELSNIRHEHKSTQKELSKSKQSYLDMKSSFESKENELDQAQTDIMQLNGTIERLKSVIFKKEQVIDQLSSEKVSLTKEISDEGDRLRAEKILAEKQFSEKCQEIDRVNELHLMSQKELSDMKKTLDDRESVIQKHEQEKGEKEQLLKETQSYVLTAQDDKHSLTQELMSVKSLLEKAQTEITHQQQELQALQNEVQNQKDKVEESKIMIKEKEDKLQEKDQTYNEMSYEVKYLQQQIEDRDQKLERAESRMADVELKLQKAENRVREMEAMHVSLEMRLEERYTVSQEAEKVLLSKEMKFKELESKLDVTEKNLANLKDQITVREESSKALAERYEVKEMEFEEQQKELCTLKEHLEEKNDLCLSLESKCKQLEEKFDLRESAYNEETGKLNEFNSQNEALIFSLEDKLASQQNDNSDLKSQYESALSKIERVSQNLDQKNSAFEGLQKQMQEKESELILCKAEASKNAQELASQIMKREESERAFSERNTELKNISKENMSLKAIVDKLTSEKDSGQVREEHLHREMLSSDERNKSLTSKLEAEKLDLASTVQVLEKENINLKEKVAKSEYDVDALNKQCTELTVMKESLSNQLVEAETERENSMIQISALETDLSTCVKERDQAAQQAKTLETERCRLEADNVQLQKEIEEATKEFQSLAQSFDESKARIENRVQEISEGKQKVEEELAALQREHNLKTSELTSRLEGSEKEIKDLSDKCSQLLEENTSLIGSVDSLKLELTQAQDFTKSAIVKEFVEEEMVCETNIRVDMAPSVSSTPTSKNTDITSESDWMNAAVEGAIVDREKDEQILALEGRLSDMKRNEDLLRKRVSEFEIVTKELQEQIVDIEKTVIVPLETENQDLKDEIGIVKQERDEAISKITKWGDEEEMDGVLRDAEAAHQRLEEVLILCEELEKKNDILLDDIQQLETKNESLLANITDYEANMNEKRDEIENLHEEIKRLGVDQQDTSILEETETTLMDRVLDLEERERLLVQELEKSKGTNSGIERVEGEIEDVNAKMRYLEQKNQILQDAEGRYMDKIMELEEDKHRLLSKLSSYTSSDNVDTSQSYHIPRFSVNMDYVSSSTQTSVPSGRDDTVIDATDSSIVVQPSSLSTSISGQSNSSSNVNRVQTICNLEDQLGESREKLEELDEKLREKDSLVLHLQEKLELLKDSEGKLMDKLLEAEEKASHLAHSKYSSKMSELNKKMEQIQEEKDSELLELSNKMEQIQEKKLSEVSVLNNKMEQIQEEKDSEISELNKKLEQIQEENDFLAENVEQYKKLFKEEKEKSNDLQDRLLEDATNASDLRKTQEELVRTQQMVEDIQSEYEEQLSDHVQEENNLRDQVTQAVAKLRDLEESLAIQTRREEELHNQVESLKAVENDLRSKLAVGKAEDYDSAMSDSGLSADDPRIRNDHAAVKDTEVTEEPIIHRSVKTVLLSKPTASTVPPQSPEGPEPTPLPRIKRKLRLQSIESVPHEQLVFLVEDLQQREAALEKRVSHLQQFEESASTQRAVELESEKNLLGSRLLFGEPENVSPYDPSSDPLNKSSRLSGFENTRAGISGGLDSDRSSTSGVSSISSTMLEKPEDVLHQRIRELEGLDKHNKNMVSELERDREVLHEIARKDKATIHDLNVKIRELQLSERSLKEQVTNLEVSENSLFTKCEELEALKLQLEDRIHELEIHERRLRELVRKLKLDEERWLSKSDGMENAVAELSANEAQLKRLVQDIEMEKGGLSERAEYLEARVRELESVEVSLLARVKDYENSEVTLQNRLVQLENAEAAAHSRASELDIVNVNLAQKHKKLVDENAVMSQHLAQLHGQVQDLDRRLLSSRDSEIAYKQHVESLQKNESLLQKKVREYELREIDSQSSIRELEQTVEICNDKLSALQRSENRLKYRVQELEGVGGQIPGELTPSQQQKVPQKMEDCQKHIVVLQAQVDNLKLQLRQALHTTQQQPAKKLENNVDEEEVKKSDAVTVEMDEYRQLHAKAALLDEYAYQNGELESSQEQLRDTILQLRQGKGACGHEVEIEVYKRRVESLQTLMSKLKSSLSSGQTTSLLDPDLGSGPQGETLPARHLQMLESERVLQSVRGLHDGKADTPTTSNGGVQSTGLAQVEESMIQAEAVQNMASLPPPTNSSETKGGQKPEQNSHLEESHWKAIEARKPVTPAATNDSRGGVSAAHGRGTNTVSSPISHHGNLRSSTSEIEEVTGVLNLQSESELSSYHRTAHNDTDSSSSPVPPPRKNRGNRLSKNLSDDNSSVSGSGSDRDPHHPTAHTATANQKHFVNEKSLPLTASNIERHISTNQQSRPPLSRFAEDSFYLPSSTQEGIDSLDDDEAPPPLPSNGPPGQEMAPLSGQSSRASSANLQDGRRESLDNSASGLSIRERIAMIEKHLQSDTHTGSHSNREEEDQLFYWKRKSTENLRQVEALDKNNKFLKEDINRLEKELEEKRRHINTLELWLSSTEDLLKNKTKQTDREMVEKLQLDLQKLRRELTQSGYRSEDVILDPAAMKTELEHKDKEISAKRFEIETLAQELRRCHKECRSIEGMRRNALDSLRALEREVVHLQETEEKLKKAQGEISALKVQYDEMDQFKNQALAMVQPLQIKVDRLAKKCRDKDVLLRRLGAELRRGLHRPSSALDELTRLERAMNGEEYNTDNSDSLSDDLSPRLVSTNRLRGRSASMDELSVNSDTDSLHMPAGTAHTPPKRQRPTPYVNTRPRSAEAGSYGLRSPRSLQPSPRTVQSAPGQQRPMGQHPRRGFDLAHDHFVAIADYDPGLFSQSGRPRLELPLREGDQVRVTGPMDRLGYCEAECNGRTGLVPANYLQPIHHSDMNGHPPHTGAGRHPSTSVVHVNHDNLEPPLEFQDQSLQHTAYNGMSPRLAMIPGQRSYKDGGMHPLPDPPSNLHVKAIQDGCLVLEWNPPPLDAQGRSNGLQVLGYMVFVDNQEHKRIPSPQFCQAVIEGINPSTLHHLGVQSVCQGGQVSPRAELVFEGTVRLGGSVGQEGQEEEEDGQEPLDTDLSSVLNSIHYSKGIKKKVMALYEYNPEQQSPHDYTAFELAFHAGDVIAVYGEPRPDGFYHGEIEGTRGLVPACFVEDLSTALRHGKGSQDSGHESSKA